ncbi:zinc finger protein 1 homolog isoform X2 [Cylas formicarius]|uniref:zinc finger protein 1 homolog isoform X2 n=1 Tax=Cylas formicarius TaxID=197179 RepID=UPI002958CCCB|nr:zinc finger protein 1 homolog isoform X2 [Cylas formicarius]
MKMLEKNYPDEICLSCLSQLENLYKFKLQIEKSEEVLKKHLGYREQTGVTQNGVCYSSQRPSVWCNSAFKHKNFFWKSEVDSGENENVTKLCFNQPPNSIVDLSKRNEILTANFADLKLEREENKEESAVGDVVTQNIMADVDNEGNLTSHVTFDCGSITSKYIEKLSATSKIQNDQLNFDNEKVHEVHNKKNTSVQVSETTVLINDNKTLTHKAPIEPELNISETHLDSNDFKISNQSESIEDVQNPVHCPVCNKTFKSKYTLNVHLKRHRLEGQFACTLCGKCFSSQGCLNRHLKIHTGEKKFECQVCQKRFLSSHNLIVHERVHTGEKPYLCSHCGKAFSNRTGLNFHVRIHTNTKPYLCNICDKAFGAQSHLVWHTMIHTGEKPFVCKICDKAFIKKCDLQRHSLVHTGVKPFQCSFCEKRFSTKLNLQYHEMIHKDDRPHICPTCDKRFIRRYYLQEHISKHHFVTENMEATNK